MAIIRQQPKFIEILDEFKSLANDDLMTQVRRVKRAAEKKNMHDDHCIILGMIERLAIDFSSDKGMGGGGEPVPRPWWEGSGKKWKKKVVQTLTEVESGEELVKKYPDLSQEQLKSLQQRFTSRGSPDQHALDIIIGALGHLVKSGLDSTVRDDEPFGGHGGVPSVPTNRVTRFHLGPKSR